MYIEERFGLVVFLVFCFFLSGFLYYLVRSLKKKKRNRTVGRSLNTRRYSSDYTTYVDTTPDMLYLNTADYNYHGISTDNDNFERTYEVNNYDELKDCLTILHGGKRDDEDQHRGHHDGIDCDGSTNDANGHGDVNHIESSELITCQVSSDTGGGFSDVYDSGGVGDTGGGDTGGCEDTGGGDSGGGGDTGGGDDSGGGGDTGGGDSGGGGCDD